MVTAGDAKPARPFKPAWRRGTHLGGDRLSVTGLTPAAIGDAAAREGIALHLLVEHRQSLEEVFMQLTADAVQYHATTGAA